MTEFFNAPTQAMGGGGLSSREGKRNRKAQAISALLSASALGLFLEACGGDGSTSSSRTCYQYRNSDGYGYGVVSCNSPLAQYYDYANPLGVATASAATVEALALVVEGNAGDAVVLVGSDEGESLLGSASDDFWEGLGGADILDGGEGTDTASYASSDIGVVVDLFTGEGQRGDAQGDRLFDIENLVGSAHDDSLTGDAEANALYGLAGADVLEGKGGDDLLAGGAGADTYVFGEGDGASTIVEVAEEGVVNTLRFEGDYEASDFSFARSSEDGTDLVIVADTDSDGQAENEVTLDGYFVSETSLETAYSIELQINDGEAFVPSLEV